MVITHHAPTGQSVHPRFSRKQSESGFRIGFGPDDCNIPTVALDPRGEAWPCVGKRFGQHVRPERQTSNQYRRIAPFVEVANVSELGGPISLDSPRAETRCTPDGFRLPSMWIVTPLAGFPREVLTRADLVRGWMRARACLHGAARQNPRNGARRRIFAASARGVLGEAVAAVTRPPGDGSGRPRRASCRPATSAAGDGCRTRSSRR